MLAVRVSFVGIFFADRWENCKKSQTKLRTRATGYMKGEPFLSKMVYACIKLGVGRRCGASPFITSLSISPRSNDRPDVVLNGDITKKKKKIVPLGVLLRFMRESRLGR